MIPVSFVKAFVGQKIEQKKDMRAIRYIVVIMSLHLIVGPMFSGKTTRIIELFQQYTDDGKVVYVINYGDDKRYHESLLSTHDKVMIPCNSAKTLSELWISHVICEIHNADIILINEGQFFKDLVPIVHSMVEEYGKTVYIAGLDGDFRRERFGTLMDLMPICDTITKLTAKCHLCAEPAPFSHRLTGEHNQIVIGSSNYIPLCRKCYRQMNL